MNNITWHVPLGRSDLTPKKATPGSMAFDLVAPCDTILLGNSRSLVKLNIAVTLPPGFAMMFGSRSGLATKGVTVEAGWIDNDYRGELGVVLYNHSRNEHRIAAGDRIAQAMLVQIHDVPVSVSYDEPEMTERGTGGFGSTGR